MTQMIGESADSSGRTGALLLSYRALPVLQIGLIAVTSFTPISVYTVWIGYAGVVCHSKQQPVSKLAQACSTRSSPI